MCQILWGGCMKNKFIQYCGICLQLNSTVNYMTNLAYKFQSLFFPWMASFLAASCNSVTSTSSYGNCTYRTTDPLMKQFFTDSCLKKSQKICFNITKLHFCNTRLCSVSKLSKINVTIPMCEVIMSYVILWKMNLQSTVRKVKLRWWCLEQAND